MLNEEYYLHSAIVTNGAHFKSIIRLVDNNWLYYDGLTNAPHWFTCDISNATTTEIKTFQGENYGIVSICYVKDKLQNTTKNMVTVTSEVYLMMELKTPASLTRIPW